MESSIAAGVFKALLHVLYVVDSFAAVGVEEGVGVGHPHEGGVGLVALDAGVFEFAEHLFGTLVVAFGDAGRNFSINASF